MATKLENDTIYSVDFQSFQEKLFPHYRKLLNRVKKLTKITFIFHTLFFIFFVSQLFVFFFLITNLFSSTFTAFVLGSIFLTVFSYSILFFYFQVKRPEELKDICHIFLQDCKTALDIPIGEGEHHINIAHALIHLSSYLDGFEKQLPFSLKWSPKFLESFNIFSHFEDIFLLKRILLLAAEEEHLQQVRLTPTDFELHTSLANCYISLYNLHKIPPLSLWLRFRFSRLLKEANEKYSFYAQKAIEEFKILEHYAPNDPWVHLQLAKIYQDLGRALEEIQEYETVVKSHLLNTEALYRLGVLYFEQGENAKGLQIYEELKNANFKKGEELISFYGSWKEKTRYSLPIHRSNK